MIGTEYHNAHGAGTVAASATPPATTLVGRLAQFFRDRPGQWVDGKSLGSIAGGYAWRTRVSDLRLKYGMRVSNRQRRVVTTAGKTIVISEYMYSPEAQR